MLQDGYKALVILGKRSDNQTTASLLQLFLEVISPGGPKVKETVAGIHKWEAKVPVLAQKFGETIGGNIKLAILIGMLPEDFQDMAMQNGSMMSVVKYENVRDHVISVATQKAAMSIPKPMDVDQVWTWNDEWGAYVVEAKKEG